MLPEPHPIYPVHVTRSGDIIGPSGRTLSPFPDKKGYTLRHGTSPKGARNPKAKLDAIDVQAIRGSSETSSELAFIFGVNPATIRSIRNRRLWSHIA